MHFFFQDPGKQDIGKNYYYKQPSTGRSNYSQSQVWASNMMKRDTLTRDVPPALVSQQGIYILSDSFTGLNSIYVRDE